MILNRVASPDFAAIKQAVSMVQVLDQYGITQQLRQVGDSLAGACPLHHGHNHTQFRVSISQNCWHCFGDCQAGGSVLDFVSRKEGVGIREAARLIQSWFSHPGHTGAVSLHGISRRPPAPAIRPNQRSPEIRRQLNRPLNRPLPNLDAGHPYLKARGLSELTIATFGLGFCQIGLMAGRILIPIHNRLGQLVAYAGRWPGEPPENTPKYKLPPGFRKSLEVFNLHRALAVEPKGPWIVVEGYFGCIELWQAGYHRTVALMGSSLSETQAQLLANAVGPHGQIILMFDEDNAGRLGREKAARCLRRFAKVKVIRLPVEGTQPDHLDPVNLALLLD
jgi:DNA primase